MKHRVAAMLVAAALAAPALAQPRTGQSAPAELVAALQRHNAPPADGGTLVREMSVTIIRRTAGNVDTVVQKMEVELSNTRSMVRGEELELGTDGTHTIRVNRVARSIHVLDHRRHRKASLAQRRIHSALPDSLLNHCRVQRAELPGGPAGPHEFVLTVDSAYRTFFNADTLTVLLDAEDEIIRLAIIHPVVSSLARTEYVVTSRRHLARDVAEEGTLFDRYFERAGVLRAEYSGFRIVGQDTRRTAVSQ